MKICHDWCWQINQKMPQQILESTMPFTFHNRQKHAYTIFRPHSDIT